MADAKIIMTNPGTIATIFMSYAPFLIIFFVFGTTFIFQNYSGAVYLMFMLAASVLRAMVINNTEAANRAPAQNPNCNVIYWGPGTYGYSTFALTFTTAYIGLPMFANSEVNYLIVASLIFYTLVDAFMKATMGCLTKPEDFFANGLCGLFLGILIPGLMYAGGSSKYLLFNELSSNKEVCSMPSKQKFKCSVYKNGELVSSSTK